MRFLVDAQLPPALVPWLRDEGHDAAHVFELDILAASDNDVWAYAVAHGYVIVTKDHDFVEWAFKRRPCPQIVWLRFGNMPNRGLFDRLKRAWPRVNLGLNNGASVVEAH